MKIDKAEAKRILRSVSPEKSFWVHNGPIVSNIETFAKILADMPEETYKYHVNKEKNDFANWIKDVLKDATLTKEILSCRNQKTTLQKIKSRIKFLRDSVKGE